MLKSYRIWSSLIMLSAISTLGLFTTACGPSKQFLSAQYRVVFDGTLDDNGYLIKDQNKTSDDKKPVSYLIDSTSQKYFTLDEQFKKEEKTGKSVNGLIAIYWNIAKYLYTTTSSLVTYAHQNISSPELLGLKFENGKNGGKVTSIAGDFLFASSSSFASGNKKGNFGFGLATLRFDLEPYKFNNHNGQPSNDFKWTDSLWTAQDSSPSDPEKLMKDRSFFKLFEVTNIAVLYKFYKFGSSTPSPFYDDKSTCVSIKENDDRSTRDFREQVAIPFYNVSSSSRQKYQAISLAYQNTFADGFVLRMQDLICGFSYTLWKDDNSKSSNNGDKKESFSLRPLAFVPYIFPKKIFDDGQQNLLDSLGSSVGKGKLPGILEPKKLQNFNEETINSNSFDNESYKKFNAWMTAIFSDFSKFLTQISSRSPQLNTPVNSLSSSVLTGKTFRNFFQYFFASKSDNPCVIAVKNSHPGSSNEKANKSPYFGVKLS